MRVVLQQHPIAQAVGGTLSISASAGGLSAASRRKCSAQETAEAHPSRHPRQPFARRGDATGDADNEGAERDASGRGSADALPVAEQAKDTLLRLQQQRAATEAFAAAIRNWTAWSGKSASLVNIYGFLAANAWMPVKRSSGSPASPAKGSGGTDGAGTHKGWDTDDAVQDLVRRLETGLSSQAQQLALYDRPLPIYTAVRVKEVGKEAAGHDVAQDCRQEARGGEEQDAEDLSLTEYEWYEWTPCDFYSADSGRSIPVWALGRQFENGTSVSVCPEMPVSILFGVWGAAFTANASEVLRSLTGLGVLEQQRLLAANPSADSSAVATGHGIVNSHTNPSATSFSSSSSTNTSTTTSNNKHVDRFQWVIDTISIARAIETPLLQGVSQDAGARQGGEGKERKPVGAHSRLAAEFQKFRFVEPFECADPFATDRVHAPRTPAAAVDGGVAGGENSEQWERGDAAECGGTRLSGSSAAGAGNCEHTRCNMKLTDAGVHINAPFPAVLRPQRRADLILCLDARSLAGQPSA